MNTNKSYHIVKYDELYDQTDKAYQFLIGKRLVWLPKSAVVHYPVPKEVEVPENLYYKKQLYGGPKWSGHNDPA